MRRLLDVEIRRFLARAAVRATGIVVLGGILVAGSVTFALSNRDVAGATERARAQVRAEYEACLRGEFGPPPDELPPGVEPGEKCFLPDMAEVTGDPRFHLTALRDVMMGVSVPLVILGIALGASFIGAEWHHGTMMTFLTWESRRVRVALAKLAASISLVGIGAVIVLLLLSLALVPAAVFRGTTEGTSSAWLGGVVAAGFRSAGLAAFGAALGGAVTLFARSTAFTVGIWFGWLAVLEGILRGLRPGWRPWLIGDNVESFVTGEGIRRPSVAALLLSAYAVALAAGAIALFRRRDVV